MINTFKIPKILFIKGVFKSDCENDISLSKKNIENNSYTTNLINISSDLLDNNNLISLNNIIINNNINNDEEQYNPCYINENNNINYYEKLPFIFESVETWCCNTNLLCWHCSLHFDTKPIFIPKVIEPIISKEEKKKYSIGVYGVFCCFGDAMEFIKNINWTTIEKIEAFNKLKFLYKIFYNKELKEIKNYPSIYDMVQYGGDLTPSNYKKIINSLSN
jgi:hypothetical protein